MPNQSGSPPLNDAHFRFCPACGASLAAPRPVTCTECGMRHWRNAKPCAGALVTHRGALLLLRRSIAPYDGWWDIPGGFCEPEEHPADAARREVMEEAGLSVSVTGQLGMWIDSYRQAGTIQSTLNVYFHAVVDGDATLRIDRSEASEGRWWAADALPEQVAFPDHAMSVLAAWRTAWEAGEISDALG